MTEIEIDGKKYPVSFGIYAIQNIVDFYDVTDPKTGALISSGFSELGKVINRFNPNLYANIVYFTVLAGCEMDNKDFDLNRVKLADWVFKNKKNKDLISLVTIFIKGLVSYVNDLKEDVEENSKETKQPKKKLTGAKT